MEIGHRSDRSFPSSAIAATVTLSIVATVAIIWKPAIRNFESFFYLALASVAFQIIFIFLSYRQLLEYLIKIIYCYCFINNRSILHI